jgi:hypothetical protein
MKYNSEVQIKLELYELYQENIFQSKTKEGAGLLAKSALFENHKRTPTQ